MTDLDNIIQINHNQKHFWVESQILDILPDSPFQNFPLLGKSKKQWGGVEGKIQQFAKQQAMLADPKLKFKYAQTSDVYRFVMGAMTEVFAEFYIKFFDSSNCNLRFLQDTSDNPMHRGSDFLGKAGYKGTLNIQAQIKWRKDPKHQFTEVELFTMLDEAKKANIDYRDLYLYVISADTNDPSEVLCHKAGFRDEYHDKMQIITGRMMSDCIINKTRIEGNVAMHPTTQFWAYFRESVNSVI